MFLYREKRARRGEAEGTGEKSYHQRSRSLGRPKGTGSKAQEEGTGQGEGRFSHSERRKEAPEEQCGRQRRKSGASILLSFRGKVNCWEEDLGKPSWGVCEERGGELEYQGGSLELGPGKDGACGKLARPPQEPSWGQRPYSCRHSSPCDYIVFSCSNLGPQTEVSRHPKAGPGWGWTKQV